MDFNFSHLYKTQVIDLGTFTVVVREIPHGSFVQMQKDLMGEISMGKDKKAIERQIASIKLSAPEFNDRRTMLGIESWTLKDNSGEIVPVCLEAWRALPHSITEQIERAIEELNPEMGEDFQD